MRQSMNRTNELQKEDPAVFVSCNAGKNYEEFLVQTSRFANIPSAFLSLNDGFDPALKASVNIQEPLTSEFVRQVSAIAFDEEHYFFVENCLEHPMAVRYGWESIGDGFRSVFAFPLRTASGVNIGCVSLLHAESIKLTAIQIEMIQYAITQLMECMGLIYQCYVDQKDAIATNRKFTHDLRNPLTVISLNTEILSMEPNVSQDILDMCNQVKNAAKSMNELIDTFSELQKKSQK